MARIYIDTNVYSYLESNLLPEHQELNRLLELYKPNLSFVFSPAHIRDKRKATQKLTFFRFLETFVGDNHLSYHGIKKKPSFYLATPIMVHNDDEPDMNPLAIFDHPEDVEEGAEEDSILSIFSSLNKALFSNISIPVNTAELDKLPDEQKEVIGELLPAKDGSLNMYDMMRGIASLHNKMHDDNEFYRQLRKVIFDGINKGQLQVTDDSADLNELFKESAFQKSFVAYVKDSLHHKDKDKIPYYDFYLHAYSLLDIMGISKDEIKKRNGYGNIFNDSLHSYYGRYCDYLVTEDKGMTKKSQILYNMFDVQTKILSVTELLELLPAIGADTEKDVMQFMEKLTTDIETGERSEPTVTDHETIVVIDSRNRYLNFFDEVVQVINKNNQCYPFLTKRQENLLSRPNYREQAAIVERCLRLFGTDAHERGAFKFDDEVAEINKDAWEGRQWHFPTYMLFLQHNVALNQFCLMIGPFNLGGKQNLLNSLKIRLQKLLNAIRNCWDSICKPSAG